MDKSIDCIFRNLHRDFINDKNDDHIDKMLKYLSEKDEDSKSKKCNKFGWEKWLQFELLRYLDTNYCNNNSLCENQYGRDQRKAKGKLLNQIDIVCPILGTNDSYAAIELKVGPSPEYAVRGIMKDLIEIDQIVASDWDLKAVLGICYYAAFDADKKKSKYISALNKIEASIETTSGWNYTIVSWGASINVSNKKAKADYHNFIVNIKDILKDNKINL